MLLRRSLALGGALLLLPALVGCRTKPPKHPDPEVRTLSRAIAAISTNYRAKSPATGDPSLGHRLVGVQPETNACFAGALGEEGAEGAWTRIQTSYALTTDNSVSLDFGSLLRVPLVASVSGGGHRNVDLTLGGVREQKLKDVYFTADSGCADDFEAAGEGLTRVITRALKAETIDISGESGVVAGVEVDVAKIGGVETSTTSSSARRWEGVGLYFADYPECLRVKVQKAECKDRAIGPGNICDLGTCSFQVETKDGGAWTGSLSCQGGSSTPFAGKLGVYSPGKDVAAGVSYNVRVMNGSGVDSVTIELRRWTVTTAEGCA